MTAREPGRRAPVGSGEAAGEQHGPDTGPGAGAGAGAAEAMAVLPASAAADVMAALPTSSAEARAAVLALLESRFCRGGANWREDVVVADVLLVTSELVTNADRHGGGLTRFTAEIQGDVLHLCVGDANPAHPVSPPAPAVPAETPRIGGYGWQMVRRLARTVTVTTHSAGKTISAVVALV
jgi:anti-sigma regulatory factor (Ser/Thr protein kinase)